MTAKMLVTLLDQVSAHKNGNVFQNPVRKVRPMTTLLMGQTNELDRRAGLFQGCEAANGPKDCPTEDTGWTDRKYR